MLFVVISVVGAANGGDGVLGGAADIVDVLFNCVVKYFESYF